MRRGHVAKTDLESDLIKRKKLTRTKPSHYKVA